MTRRKTIAALAIVVLSGVLATALWLRGPTYEGRTVNAWMQDLGSDSMDKFVEARKAIKALGIQAQPTILSHLQVQDSKLKSNLRTWAKKQSWIKFEFDDPTKRRRLAMEAFHLQGGADASIIPGLLLLLCNDDREIREPAYALLKDLSSKANSFRELFRPTYLPATWPLEKAEHASTQVLPALLKAARNPDPILRQEAVESLRIAAWFLPHPSFVVPTLIKSTRDSSPYVQLSAISALGDLRLEAQAAIPALTILCEDRSTNTPPFGGYRVALDPMGLPLLPIIYSKNHTISGEARAALEKIEPAKFLATHLAALRNINPITRREAIHALSQSQGMHDRTVPVLIERLSDEVPFLRVGICLALENLGPDAKIAIPALVRLTTDQTPIQFIYDSNCKTVGDAAKKALKAINRSDVLPTS